MPSTAGAAGWKIGLVRPRLLWPFPEARLREILTGKKGAAVIDQNISLGKGGVLFAELASALYGLQKKPVLTSFIDGLGGRDISPEEFYEMAAVTRQAAVTGKAPPTVSSIPKKNSAKSANFRLLLRSSAEDWENRHERHQI